MEVDWVVAVESLAKEDGAKGLEEAAMGWEAVATGSAGSVVEAWVEEA